QPICAPQSGWEPPPPDALLGPTLGTSLNQAELFLAGELLRWLLDTRGPSGVLDFMADLNRSDTPDEVRAEYLERFGSPIDLDLYAHWRPVGEPLAPERAGCLGPEAPRDSTRSRISLEASFDCGSSAVRNDFTNPGRAFVEWTLTIDESTAGTYHLGGLLPDGFALTISTCECRPLSFVTQLPPNDSFLWSDHGGFHPDYGATLAPGAYRLRAYGPIGSSLDFEIFTPCNFVLQNCPNGQQCTPKGRCKDEVEDPGQHGDSCWPTFVFDEETLPCDAGLSCIGLYDQPGVCLPYCDEDTGVSCPGELSCEVLSTCTSTCDPFVADCDDGWTCVANFETGGGGCYPVPGGDLGLLESCWQIEFTCAPGLTCKNLPLDGCHDPESWIDFSGCCTPICDPAAPDPGCPPELPNCELRNEEGVLGTCRP
ncbi:MAG TPA: hypothetical protein VK034_12795, partial [Enhygromyxa sp.]|nr:hypothetical protein [Enhygromyxa sp.]